MRDLLNFIFANLVPIIVVVSIALRIIGGMKGRKKQPFQGFAGEEEGEDEEQGPGEEYIEVWDRLQPDEESRPSPGPVKGPGGGPVHPPVQNTRPLLMPAPGRPGPSRPVPAPLGPPPLNPVPAPRGPAPRPPEPEAPAKKAPVFRRLENLSPLRRAVILAEILGPPRGLSNFPAE
jgi:hypothetical protein